MPSDLSDRIGRYERIIEVLERERARYEAVDDAQVAKAWQLLGLLGIVVGLVLNAVDIVEPIPLNAEDAVIPILVLAAGTAVLSGFFAIWTILPRDFAFLLGPDQSLQSIRDRWIGDSEVDFAEKVIAQYVGNDNDEGSKKPALTIAAKTNVQRGRCLSIAIACFGLALALLLIAIGVLALVK